MNPFTPIFGQIPACLAGRDEIVSAMRSAFDSGWNDPNLSSLIIGPRGVGKTALASVIANEAEERGWVSAQVTALPGMLEDVYQQGVLASRHIVDSGNARELTGIGVAGVLSLEFESSTQTANWRTRMTQLVEQLNAEGVGLLIVVDEVDSSLPEMAELSAVYQHFVQEGRKVALLMAGLPGNVSALLGGKSTSFLRRARQHHLRAIRDDQVATAMKATLIQVGVSIDEDALECAVGAVEGYAYMLQLLGYWAFEQLNGNTHMTLSHVERGLALAENDMRNSVIAQTYGDFSEGDIRFLQAMLLDEGPSRMADIARRMGVTASYASQYRLRLVSLGAIGERGRGKVDFDLPMLRDYVRQNAGFEGLPSSGIACIGFDNPMWAMALGEVESLAEDFAQTGCAAGEVRSS